jgi:predicted acyltransferase (DUF342 family)
VIVDGEERMKSNVSVPPGGVITIGDVDGDLEVGRRATVKASAPQSKIIVKGRVYCAGDDTFEASLQAEGFEAEQDVVVLGDLEVTDEVEVDDGRLEVYGNMIAEDVDISDMLHVHKNLKVTKVDVGGRLRVEGTVSSRYVDVGGAFESEGEVVGDKIDVGGSFRTKSNVDIKDLEVGGTAEIKGGRIGRVDVGGKFESEASIEFGNIDVGGRVKLSGSNKGGDVDVGGSFTVQGDLEFRSVDVGGTVEITGSAIGGNLEVGGRVEIGGSLNLSYQLDVGGRVEVSRGITAGDIEVGGTLRANKITVKERLRVGGRIETTEGATARLIEIGSNGEVRGSLKGDIIMVGRNARVENVFGKEIHLHTGATATNVYGEKVIVEPHCQIHGEVQYTGELRVSESVSLASPPRKVNRLPL